MALSQYTPIQWNDIANLLSEINIVRNKLSLNTTSVSGGGVGNTAKASTINDLWNALFACNGINYPVFSFNGLTSFETVFVNQINLPNKGELIKLQPIFAIQDELNKVKALNTSGFCTSSFGVCSFTPNSSCFGFTFFNNTSCFGFTPNTSCFTNRSDNTSCFTNRSDNTTNRTFTNKSNFSCFTHRTFNTSCFTNRSDNSHRSNRSNHTSCFTHRSNNSNRSNRSNNSNRSNHTSCFGFSFSNRSNNSNRSNRSNNGNRSNRSSYFSFCSEDFTIGRR